MPGRKNGTRGAGRGSAQHGRQMGHGAGSKRERQDGELGQHRDATPDSTDQSELHRGRSESSPGHLKKAAGAQSARDYAPGRTGQAGAFGEEGGVGRSRRGTILSEVAPDELGEDES
jgi:hypothetical protein